MARPARLLVVLGTRPEAIKLFPVIRALREDVRFTVRVCNTGQHDGLVDSVLTLAGIEADHDLALMRPGQSLDALTAALLTGIGKVMDREAPDRVVVQGDTATALAAALAAYHRRIPLDHVEAGLRSHDIYAPWPEEGNRKLIAGISSRHFAPTEAAAAALRGEAVPASRVHVVGNTVIDALQWVRAHCPTPADHAIEAGLRRFAGRRIIAVTSHRRESHGEGLKRIARALGGIAARPDVALIFPLHPNPAVRGVFERALCGFANVALIEPLDYPQFLRLLEAAHLVLTDSGGVQEEAPALGTPVLVMRSVTERTEAVEAGTARLIGTDADSIIAATLALLDDDQAHAAMSRAHHPFGDGRAAQRIVAILGEAAG